MATCAPLFKTGSIVYGYPSDPGQILAGGGKFYAVPFEKKVHIYRRDNGNNYQCLISPERIPQGSPIVWAHRGTCVLAAVRNKMILWHIEQHNHQVFELEGQLLRYFPNHPLTMIQIDHQEILYLAVGLTFFLGFH